VSCWRPEASGYCSVAPQQVQKSTGRSQRGRHDDQCRQRLYTFGLLAGAFHPPEQVCVLRSYLRQRAILLTYAAQPIQHMQQALTQMHSKLQHVASVMTGVTGCALIRAMLASERDPMKLAPLRDYRCKHDAATIARALPGSWREEDFARKQCPVFS
jgi:transposase